MQIEVVGADFGNNAHRSGIVEVLDSYASDPVGGGQPLTADVRERVVPLLRDHPSTLVLLALAEARVVGMAVCFLNLSTFRARPVLHVGDLAVLPEFRGKGVGRTILTVAEAKARDLGCCRMALEVQDDNRRAIALYRTVGFTDLVFGDSEPTRHLIKPLDG